MMDCYLERLQNSKVPNRIGRDFLRVISSQSCVCNNQRNGRLPIDDVIMESNLISNIPDTINQINHGSLNNNFALRRPVHITNFPYVFHCVKLKN
jgi:hypothetical protein